MDPTPPKRPEECSSCAFPTSALTLYNWPPHPPSTRTAWLCKACASTPAGNVYIYHMQHDHVEKSILRTLCYCTNLILTSIDENAPVQLPFSPR